MDKAALEAEVKHLRTALALAEGDLAIAVFTVDRWISILEAGSWPIQIRRPRKDVETELANRSVINTLRALRQQVIARATMTGQIRKDDRPDEEETGDPVPA